MPAWLLSNNHSIVPAWRCVCRWRLGGCPRPRCRTWCPGCAGSGEFGVDDATAGLLVKIAPATINRRLAPERAKLDQWGGWGIDFVGADGQADKGESEPGPRSPRANPTRSRQPIGPAPEVSVVKEVKELLELGDNDGVRVDLTVENLALRRRTVVARRPEVRPRSGRRPATRGARPR